MVSAVITPCCRAIVLSHVVQLVSERGFYVLSGLSLEPALKNEIQSSLYFVHL